MFKLIILPLMERHHRYVLASILSFIVFLGLVSFICCIVADIKRAKKEDIKVDGELCYVPETEAFGFGVTALICLCFAQIIGSSVICSSFCRGSRGKKSHHDRGSRKGTIASTLLVLSWISFAIAIIVMGTATSMNKRQPYGKGWLNGECYLVKSGAYFGAAASVLVAMVSLLASAIVLQTRRTFSSNHLEQRGKEKEDEKPSFSIIRD